MQLVKLIAIVAFLAAAVTACAPVETPDRGFCPYPHVCAK